MTRDELDKLTKKELIDLLPNERATKEQLIGALLAIESVDAPEPELDAAPFLASCTYALTDNAGQVHTVNPGQPHTIALSGFPEAMRNYPGEWTDIGGPITVALDGAEVLTSRLVHATERKV